MRIWVYILVLLALYYNAALAIINAHLFSVSLFHVALSEATILGFSLYYSLRNLKNNKQAKLTFAFLAFFVSVFFLNSFLSVLGGNSATPKPLRDILILFTFLLLGYSQGKNDRDLNKLVALSAGLTLIFLLFELLRTDAFVKLFNISSYYAHTRGGEVDEEEPGLFRTAGSYSGRFSFGFRTAQRLSSLFLEQTTHANFSIILAIFLSARWTSLRSFPRLLILSTIILIILGTDSRQAGGICLIILLGYFLFPRVKKISLYFYIPAAILLMLVSFYDPNITHRQGDDFSGRLGYSISRLFNSDLEAILGMRSGEKVVDSGYTYLLYSHSLIGFLVFCFFLPRILPYDSSESKRLSHSTMVFYTANLAVSGSTIFSIKTSALLWFVIGCFCAKERLLRRSTSGINSSANAMITPQIPTR